MHRVIHKNRYRVYTIINLFNLDIPDRIHIPDDINCRYDIIINDVKVRIFTSINNNYYNIDGPTLLYILTLVPHNISIIKSISKDYGGRLFIDSWNIKKIIKNKSTDRIYYNFSTMEEGGTPVNLKRIKYSMFIDNIKVYWTDQQLDFSYKLIPHLLGKWRVDMIRFLIVTLDLKIKLPKWIKILIIKHIVD